MKINIELLKDLERTIDTINPEKGKIPIKILGYGEISLVFEIVDDPLHLAYKRIPIFDSVRQVKRHVWAFDTYNRILREDLGIILPEQEAIWFKDEEGKIQFYIIQQKVDTEAVGNHVIHNVSDQEVETLILLAMREMKKIWMLNKTNENLDLGIDGQISNFVVLDYNPNNPKIDETKKLLYLDTSTPMFRKNGAEAMEAILFLKSAPSFLRFLLKALFLQEVLDRYYDWRLVTIDLLANFFKEQKPEIIPLLIRRINRFFKEEAIDFNIEPITIQEVQKYYKSDKTIWVAFQNTRRIDRYIKTKLFRKKYNFYLPGKIKR
ncbi:MAG: hypothetical protein JSV23_11045 [Promethearchaeota archaeon]|nr:MAG: hypothetical protein JSV23_11045 [Candidatus Lokiarchaeota archaeon]